MIFIVTLLIKAKDWKQTKYPSVEKVENLLNKLWYSHTIEFLT